MITVEQTDKGRFYDGLPSITTVLPSPECPKGMTGEQWAGTLATAAAFGNIIHDGCEQIANGKAPDVDAPEDKLEMAGQFLTVYWAWFSENVSEVLHVEEPFINKAVGFGGTPDLVAMLNDGDLPAIIDTKAIWPPSAKQRATYEMQLAAQGMLFGKPHRRISLRLRKESPTKPPQIKEYPYDDNRSALVEMRFLNYLEGFKLDQKMNGETNEK